MFSDPKFVWADNFLLDLKLFLDTNIFVGKIIWTKKLLDLYFFTLNFIRPLKNFDPKFVGLKFHS